MRWDALFADLEAESQAGAEAERRSEVADRTRAEWARLRLMDRLRPLLDGAGLVKIAAAGQPPVSGALRGLGVDWLLLTGEAGEEVVVPLAAVQWLTGTGPESAEPGWEGMVGARLGLRVVLRRILRDRSPVIVGLTSGDSVSGRLARVGADHLELDLHEPARRSGEAAIGALVTVPLGAIALLRRR